MTSFAVTLQCPNSDCLYETNTIGQPVCDRCQTSLTYRYLWAVGSGLADLTSGTLVDCRYLVVSPQIWLDTQPSLAPRLPLTPLPQTLPYLHLYPHQQHLPNLFAIHQPDDDQPPIFLLENAPIDAPGQLQPSLEAAWASAPAVRQLNWLWQMWQLWQPLQAEGMVASLLVAENLHVEGWRLRLRELIADPVLQPVEALVQRETVQRETVQRETVQRETRTLATLTAGAAYRPQPMVLPPQPVGQPLPLTASFLATTPQPVGLPDLADLWQSWTETAHASIQTELRDLCEALRSVSDRAADRQQITARLNQLLLAQAATWPLQLEVAGGTTTGPQRSHNEDACYAIVCDGIGGHAGGEVASQLAVRSLQLQLRTWLTELKAQSEPLLPGVIEQQLTEIVRVVNNLIAAQNDAQGREQRQRMATTLVMAVQAPQPIQTATGSGNSHELYLVHVGDSRAYWLTAHACQLLTVDDDVATREVRAGRSFWMQAQQRVDASALTQALGTREGSQLNIHVQRLILEEDGILLLCSDGLSDRHLVEQVWDTVTQPVLRHTLNLQDAVQQWLTLTNQHNGQDNASVALMHCRLSQEPQIVMLPSSSASQTSLPIQTEPELTETARALLYDDEAAPQPVREAVLPKMPTVADKPMERWLVGLGAAAFMFVLGALGVAVWRELAPTGFAPRHTAPPAVEDSSIP
jgi:protein phosphatase